MTLEGRRASALRAIRQLIRRDLTAEPAAAARVLGTLYVCGASLAVLWYLLPHGDHEVATALLIPIVGAAACGVLIILAAGRLNAVALPFLLLPAIAAITAAGVVNDQVQGPFPLFDVWLAVYAVYFLPQRSAWAVIGLALAVLAAQLVAMTGGPTGEALSQWVIVSGTAVVVAGLVTLLTEGIRRSEQRFSYGFDYSPEGIAVVGLDGRIEHANDALAAQVGRLRDELNGLQLRDLVHEDDRDRLDAQLPALRGGRTRTVRLELRLARPSGEEAHADLTVTRLPGRDSDHVLVQSKDVTDARARERHLLELTAALGQSEERYRLLFKRNPQPTWVFDRETLRFVAVNRAAAELYGWSREEMLEMTIRDIRAPEDVPALEHAIENLGEGPGSGDVWRHRTRDGRLIDVELRADDIVFDGRPSRIVQAHDITERLAAERERATLQAQLHQAQRLEGLGQLAGGVAHDFNNLLGAIMGFAELTSRQLDGHPAREFVDEIHKASEMAASLTRQLLLFSRREASGGEPVELGGVVMGMHRLLSSTLGERIELELELPDDAPGVLVDHSQLEQVVLNLAVNARDAMSGGGRLRIATGTTTLDEAHARLTGTLSPGDYATLTVSDTGCGMAPEIVARVFEPFFSTKGKGHGTGLGLATCYGVIARAGGHIEVQSAPGEGTTFTVLLPAITEPAEAAPKLAATPLPNGGGETILLAEDEDALRTAVEAILADHGYSVIVAKDPGRALELARAHDGPIDLLLSDVVMPIMSGPELAREILSIRPGIKVLFMSGYIGDPERLPAGARLLDKPVRSETLLREVGVVLASG